MQGISKEPIHRWKTQLTRREITLIEEDCADFLTALGYDGDRLHRVDWNVKAFRIPSLGGVFPVDFDSEPDLLRRQAERASVLLDEIYNERIRRGYVDRYYSKAFHLRKLKSKILRDLRFRWGQLRELTFGRRSGI